MNVQKVLLCPFQCEPRPSGVTLESAGRKNIPQVPGNRAEVGQNHDARRAGYMWSRKLENERSKSLPVSSLLQTKDVGGQFRVPGNGKYPPTSGKFSRSWSKSRRAYGGLGYSFSLNVKWGNISPQKLETECLKSFAVSISLQTKAIRSQYRDPGSGKYPPNSRKFSRSLSKSPGRKAVLANLSVLK